MPVGIPRDPSALALPPRARAHTSSPPREKGSLKSSLQLVIRDFFCSAELLSRPGEGGRLKKPPEPRGGCQGSQHCFEAASLARAPRLCLDAGLRDTPASARTACGDGSPLPVHMHRLEPGPRQRCACPGAMHDLCPANSRSCPHTEGFHPLSCPPRSLPSPRFNIPVFLHSLEAAERHCRSSSASSDLTAGTAAANTALLVAAHEAPPLRQEPGVGHGRENQPWCGPHAGKE